MILKHFCCIKLSSKNMQIKNGHNESNCVVEEYNRKFFTFEVKIMIKFGDNIGDYLSDDYTHARIELQTPLEQKKKISKLQNEKKVY